MYSDRSVQTELRLSSVFKEYISSFFFDECSYKNKSESVLVLVNSSIYDVRMDTMREGKEGGCVKGRKEIRRRILSRLNRVP